MPLSTQITLRDIPSSPALETDIRENIEKLEQFCDGVTRCRVTVELEGHKHQGRQFRVAIEISIPDGDFTVNHQHDEDVHVALREAFHAARRKLEDFARVRRGDVKRHGEAAAS